MAVQVSSLLLFLTRNLELIMHQSVLNGLLKSFDDRPISQEKRANVNAKLDQGVERIRGLKRKVPR